MNIKDFFVVSDYKDIKNNVDARKEFEEVRKCKVGNKVIELMIKGKFVSEELANDIWHGNNYLLHIDSNLTGGGEYTGCGYATDKLDKVNTWDTFKEWVDNMMKRYKGYELEEFGQLVMF